MSNWKTLRQRPPTVQAIKYRGTADSLDTFSGLHYGKHRHPCEVSLSASPSRFGTRLTLKFDTMPAPIVLEQGQYLVRDASDNLAVWSPEKLYANWEPEIKRLTCSND